MILLLFLAANFSCSEKNEVFQKLEQIDAMLYETLDESADSLLNTINPEELDTPEKEMYYNLLKTGVKYRTGEHKQNDSIINRCVEYYEKTGDKEKLAMSILARAYSNYNVDDANSLLDMKRAATLAESIGNYGLMAKTYSGLTVYTGNAGESQLSLMYAQKEVAAAKKSEKEALLVYAYLQLSIAYRLLGIQDSALFYARQSELYVNDFQPIYKAYIYYNLGLLFRSSNDSLSEVYLKKSLSCEPLSQAYNSLADIYQSRGDHQSASDMWNNAIKNSNYAQRAKVFDAMASSEYKKGHFEECCNALINKNKNLVDFYEWKLTNKALELENKYNLSLYQQKIRSRVIITVLVAVLAVALLLLLHRIRVRRIESRKMKMELDYEKAKSTLAMLESQISALEMENVSQSKEMGVLKDKAAKLKGTMMRNLQHGHDLYDRLTRSESAANWSDYDLLCLLDFVSTINQAFIVSLDNNYNDLNASQKLFLVVSDLLQKNDFEICQMLGLEKQSLRNKRNRIEKKLVVGG